MSGYGDMDSGRLPCKSMACPSNSRGPVVQDHGRINGSTWRLWMGMLHEGSAQRIVVVRGIKDS